MPEESKYHEHIRPSVGGRVAAVFVAGMVGPGTAQSLLSWVDLSEAGDAEVLPLLHAIELEEQYLEQVLDFDEPPKPLYGGELNLRALEPAFDVDRLVCLVTLREDGQVYAARNYEGVEMTQLEALHEQFDSISNSVMAHGMAKRRRRAN